MGSKWNLANRQRVNITENVEVFVLFGSEVISQLSSVKQHARMVASFVESGMSHHHHYFTSIFNSYVQVRGQFDSKFQLIKRVYTSDWQSVERCSTDSFPESELTSAFCCSFSAEEHVDPKIN